MKAWNTILKWWYFTFRNPVVRAGEHGGFRWTFRRFTMHIRSISGNFMARFTAAEHPYGYLIVGKGDDNIEGYIQTLYMVAMLLTTDQGFVDDVNKAIMKYQKRLEKIKPEDDDKHALLEMQELQDHIELSGSDRRKAVRDIDKRFKKDIEKLKHPRS